MTSKGYWLAWDPDDTDVDGPVRYAEDDYADAYPVAQEHAEHEYARGEGEHPREFTVVTRFTDAGGIEGPLQRWKIVVDFIPVFDANLYDVEAEGE